jgi:hypothetical protein
MFITGNKYKIMGKFGGNFHWNWGFAAATNQQIWVFKITPKEY